MEEQGWFAKQLGAPSAPSVPKASVPTEDLPPEVQAAPPAPNLPKANAPAEGLAPEVRVAPAAPSVPQAGAAAESPPPPVQSAPAAAHVAPSSTRIDSPSAQHPIVVKDWFKFGGTADDLAAAKQRCATKLGPADRPDPESDAVSSEMIDCLRNEGWHAF